MPAVNALCLATVLYRSRLVPRLIPTIGLVGMPLLVVSTVASLFGAWDQVSAPAMLLAAPIAAWEFSLGAWLTVKGVDTAAVRDRQPSPPPPSKRPSSACRPEPTIDNAGAGLFPRPAPTASRPHRRASSVLGSRRAIRA